MRYILHRSGASVKRHRRTVTAVSSVTSAVGRLLGVADTTELDEAVRAWLRKLTDKKEPVHFSKSEISRWMGYEESRTQLDNYLAGGEKRNFTVAYIAKIAEGMKITPAEAWMQIYDEIPKGRRRSPLHGKAEREREQQHEPPPVVRPAKTGR
jgi:methionine synthase II (cobalamin-independent)